MEEQFVVESVKEHLKNKWKIFNSVKDGKIEQWSFIPDIVVENDEKDIMAIEAKGSLDLNGLMQGVGQCVTYSNYGANIICFAVPEDREKVCAKIIKNITIFKNGKIGLYSVKEDGSVRLSVRYKKFKLPDKFGKLIKDVRKKLIYVADIKIEEIGSLLEFAYNHRGRYNNKKEFLNLVIKSIQNVFPSRKFTTDFSKKKIVTNFFVTFNHLSLWDNSHFLNDRGKSLMYLYKKDKKIFKDKLANFLLTEGNWLGLLSVMHEISSSSFNTKHEYDIELLKELIKEEYLDNSKKIDSWAKKLYDRYYRFLNEFDFIEANKNNSYTVRWKRVIKILKEF